MKQISEEQINQVLQAIYTTNMPASQFDQLKMFFSKLEEVKSEEPTQKTKKDD